MSALTELDLTVDEIAEIYYAQKWYPVKKDGTSDVDVEERIRDVLRSLLREIVKVPENEEGTTGTMRLFIEKDPQSNFAQIFLQIGSVEW